MSIRVTYEHELQELNKDLKEMAHMVVTAIEQTFIAFEDQNFTLAEEIIKGDRTVNDMERAIESRCLSLILRQQPVAGDLRQVSTALKVVTDSGAHRGPCFRHCGADSAPKEQSLLPHRQASAGDGGLRPADGAQRHRRLY